MKASDATAVALRSAPLEPWGVLIGLAIIVGWLFSTAWLLSIELPAWYWTLPLILLQSHLYTGLFITAHDAMHGLVSRKRWVNLWIGRLSAGLFAFNSYDKLLPNHHAHHRHVATDEDPDFYRGGFWRWYLSFALHYITWWQIVLMAIAFNIMKLWLPTENLLLFWILPSILATFQLFIFGTYLTHRQPPNNPHKARSQYWGHAWSFLTCYFFGYHYEHHNYPYLPWWRLWRVANTRPEI